MANLLSLQVVLLLCTKSAIFAIRHQQISHSLLEEFPIRQEKYVSDVYNWLQRIPSNYIRDHIHNFNLIGNLESSNYALVQNISVALNVFGKDIAVMVPLRKEAQIKSAMIASGVLRMVEQRNFLLYKYNRIGVTSLLANATVTGKTRFLEHINDAGHPYAEEVGAEIVEENLATFFSIIKVSAGLKKYSSIILFADRAAIDEDLCQLATKTVELGDINIIVVWNGPYPTHDNRELLLSQISGHSKGKFFVAKMNPEIAHYESTYLPHVPVSNLYQTIVAHRTNLFGVNEMHIPIDSAVTAVHFRLPKRLTKALFISRNESITLDLLNDYDIHNFAPGSTSYNVDSDTRQVLLNVEMRYVRGKPVRNDAGRWRLRVDDDTSGSAVPLDRSYCEGGAAKYNVTVSVESEFRLALGIVNDTMVKGKKVLRMDILGNYTRLGDVVFLSPNGTRYHGGNALARIRYKVKENLRRKLENQQIVNHTNRTHNNDEDIETLDKNLIEIDWDALPVKPFYMQINGTDPKGNEFVRMAYVDKFNILNPVPPTTIEMGIQTELGVGMHQTAPLYFEVTNNRDRMAYMRFGARDEQSMLLRIQPLAAYVNPGQTVVVVVYIYGRPNAGRNRVTFSAFTGTYRYPKFAEVYLSTEASLARQDRDWPELAYTFSGDCFGVTVCHEKVWNIKITAKDTGSGLLQITSNPRGLTYPADYVSGTNEDVHAFYRATCCEPKIQLIAYDANRNRRTVDIDAYWPPLNGAVIAAIVLGVLAGVLLIAATITYVLYRRRRNRTVSVDLPTYRGPLRSANTERY